MENFDSEIYIFDFEVEMTFQNTILEVKEAMYRNCMVRSWNSAKIRTSNSVSFFKIWKVSIRYFRFFKGHFRLKLKKAFIQYISVKIRYSNYTFSLRYVRSKNVGIFGFLMFEVRFGNGEKIRTRDFFQAWNFNLRTEFFSRCITGPNIL